MTRILLGACVLSATIPPAFSASRLQQPEGFVTADDGSRLFYRIEGEGPQTLIVPGDLFLHRDLRALAKGRRVVFYDMRGRGRSDRVEDTTHITIQWDVRDLETVRRFVGAERASLVGFSYLGLMVLLYAQDHPERVNRIVQIGPVPRRWDTSFPPELTANDPAPVPDSAAREELTRLANSDLADRDPKAHCERVWRISRVRLIGDPRLADRVPMSCDLPNEWSRNFDRHLRHHFVGSVQRLDVPWEAFERVTAPVLTIHGTKDRNAPYGAGREWATRLPDARLYTVVGAAHMPWIDQPQVLDAIDEFLNGSWPAAAQRLRPRG